MPCSAFNSPPRRSPPQSAKIHVREPLVCREFSANFLSDSKEAGRCCNLLCARLNIVRGNPISKRAKTSYRTNQSSSLTTRQASPSSFSTTNSDSSPSALRPPSLPPHHSFAYTPPASVYLSYKGSLYTSLLRFALFALTLQPIGPSGVFVHLLLTITRALPFVTHVLLLPHNLPGTPRALGYRLF